MTQGESESQLRVREELSRTQPKKAKAALGKTRSLREEGKSGKGRKDAARMVRKKGERKRGDRRKRDNEKERRNMEP
eukprot:6206771-Pleurochrysis_carterae.AAC.2